MTHQKKLSLVFLSVALSALTSAFATSYWNWQSINIHQVNFPASFLWGSTSLSYEVNGYSKTSTWYTWEKQVTLQGKPFAQTRSGNASAHSLHATHDLQLMKDMGLSLHCLSLDWSRIEPEEGYFDEQVIEQYVDECAKSVENGIMPLIAFKDHCDPLWFGYLGGFEQEKNIQFFERYCLKMYTALQPYVTHWITFWAPEAYAMMGYLAGTIPPGLSNAHKAVTVLKNEYEAHVRVYKALKSAASSSNNEIRIGIVKHMHALDPWHVWDYTSCYLANLLTNTSFYSFFTTGTMNVKLPIPGKAGAWVTYTNAYAPKSLDFIGINYYGHSYIKNIFNHTNNPSEILTDIAGMTVYPEGLYYAIKDVADNIATKLNIPMIITQNGIATTDENIRDLYIKRHLYALSKALADGYNVFGYCYHSLLDGFAWGSFDTKFGLFSVDYTTLERKQKSGSSYYADVVKKCSAQNN